MAPKYKLFSNEDGKPRPCAFYMSEKGCKNGDNCKFAHVNPKQEEGGSDDNVVVSPRNNNNKTMEDKSVVSSESGGEDGNENPFAPQQQQQQQQAPLDRKRKNRKGPNSNPFAGKTAKTAPSDTPNTQTKKNKKQSKSTEQASSKPAGFRSMNLPVTDFMLPESYLEAKSPAAEQSTEETDAPSPTKQQKTAPSTKSAAASAKGPKKGYPVPKSHEIGRKWLHAVKQAQKHAEFGNIYDAEKWMEADEDMGGKTSWIKAKPYGDWCKDNPQVIAVDCEMCETEDPVSKRRNPMALCRVSIVDAATDEVLLNTLVKPEWPVVDYRTFVNGISESDLAHVQFTIRHCQAFLMALCSEETVIVGHAVHHDIKAMRMEHYCCADSALLYRAKDSETATVSLRDLAFQILDHKEMPKVHDSVNDARTALRCMEHWVENDGDVEHITRRPKEPSSAAQSQQNRQAHMQLFCHRIPPKVTTKHLADMFLANTMVAVERVDDIEYGSHTGKTLVTFASAGHANLAFSTLVGTPDEDPSGRLQKRVFLRGGQYIRIRKMVHERPPHERGQHHNGHAPQQQQQQQNQQQQHRRSYPPRSNSKKD